MKKLLGLVGIGAALTYFFHPAKGERRRAYAKNRVFGLANKVRIEAEGSREHPDDVTLAHKVETELFRDDDVPKGQININAENGKVFLRGEVDKPELIDDLEKRTRSIHGVQDVENLLHTPGAQAPAAS
jgi:osmotically-inducible protein OsmY